MQQDVRIACIAFVSRLAFLAAAFVSDVLLDDYDSSSGLNSRPCNVSDTAQEAGIIVKFANVWDTVFYDRISRCGYEYEHYFAFFPGLPYVMGLAGGSAGRRVLVALVMSLISFTASMVLFFRCDCPPGTILKLEAVSVPVYCKELIQVSQHPKPGMLARLFQGVLFCNI